MRALVLGGSVFVGRRLVEALVAAGQEVTVLNRGLTPAALPAGVGRLVADRTDADSMAAALHGTTWDVLYDVSGFVMAAGGSDVGALLDLVERRVGHYVFVSSIMAYDPQLAGLVPWTEDLPTDPFGPRTYGGFKAVVERSLLERHVAGRLAVTIVRPAAIYGPHNNIYDMEAAMFLRLRQGRPVLVPHSGLVTASYGHVDDLCDALLVMAGHPRAMGEVFNVTAEAVTSRRYAETLAQVVEVEARIIEVPDDVLAGTRPPICSHLFLRPHHGALSVDKVRSRLGVEPRFDLRSGHEDTYRWFVASGLVETDQPLRDPVWRATWDFEAEDAVAARLGYSP